eukprot:CAMPEP_0195532580 /NCGR_PEP_ID=MMETSP0794_2-20130614/38545_1 /TAXON_ID=515487 /ORGANISM="Stephanopyxis turris, Strain CCMP 815" /LENGTH=508 /DNA_ID=CAMNT_0040664853 /DNA_START=228 /DNA_END=1754 /DNA_ORIENTATION=-
MVFCFNPRSGPAALSRSPLFRRLHHNPEYRSCKGRMSAQNFDEDKEEPFRKRDIGNIALKTYVDYASRLWKETDPDARRKIAEARAVTAVQRVEHLMNGEEYFDLVQDHNNPNATIAREKMLEACHMMLNTIQAGSKGTTDDTATLPSISTGTSTSSSAHVVEEASSAPSEESLSTAIATNESDDKKKALKHRKKPRRSILFGAVMGAIVAGWVFSGNYVFTGLFTLMTILGQLEYYRMVMNAGIYPARKISVVGAASMFITALLAPNLHQICLPFFSIATMIWFLTMRRQVSTISEIATTFTGMFYLGYIPSFWVRIRLIGGGQEPTRLAPIMRPILELLGKKASHLPSFIPKSVHLPVTAGAVFIFWSWLSIAFSDVGAYFSGRRFGKTKLGQLAPAAGATSPNKTVEGAIGGCVISAFLATVGAWVQKWPYWAITGPIHGICLGLLGLIGDLTASMLKRDAGLKDFGDLIPEHGGIMDRVDSYVFTAPYSWLVLAYILPALKAIS